MKRSVGVTIIAIISLLAGADAVKRLFSLGAPPTHAFASLERTLAEQLDYRNPSMTAYGSKSEQAARSCAIA